LTTTGCAIRKDADHGTAAHQSVALPFARRAARPVVAPGITLSDLRGVCDIPAIPTNPQSHQEAECRAGRHVRNRITGGMQGAALNAIGLPGNTLEIWRRSREIARRIENRAEPEAALDPCDNF